MPEKVKIIAQICMDAFYQTYKPADAFLRLQHFTWLCLAADSKLKLDEYNAQIALNLRKRTPNAPVKLNQNNYITVEADIKDGKAKLPFPVMTYSGADSNFAIAQAIPEGNCSSFMPISPEELWQIETIKDVVFWYSECDGLKFFNLGKVCNPKKVTVTYIPQLTEKSAVDETRKWAILNMVTVFVKSAKDGVIIDMSNDGNANTTSQTEINKYLLKALSK